MEEEEEQAAQDPAKVCHFVDFVDVDLLDRIVGVGPCHPQARTEVAVLTRTYEQRSRPALLVNFSFGLLLFIDLLSSLELSDTKVYAPWLRASRGLSLYS